MADLGSTKVFGKLTVIHDATLKSNAEINGDVDVSGVISGDGSGLTNIPLNEGLAIVSSTAPTNPENGSMWFDTNDNSLNVWISALTSWTKVSPGTGPIIIGAGYV